MVAMRKSGSSKVTAATKNARSKTAPGAASPQEISKAFDACIQRGNAKLKPVADELRQLVKKTVHESRETLNPWGIPSFDFHGPFCFLMVGKNHVTFGFSRGTSLPDPAGLLAGTGKNLRHVKLKDVEQLRAAPLLQLILDAAALNRVTPLTPSMRVKKPQ